MTRHTIRLPDQTEELVRSAALEGESFSATLARLVEAGARAIQGGISPSYIGMSEGPEDLGINAESYLRGAAERVPGRLKGQIHMTAEFDDPLP